MACTKPASPHHAGDGTPQGELLDQLDKLDTYLMNLQHVCGLMSDLAGQRGNHGFTDGLQLERFQVVFNWIAEYIEDLRDHPALDLARKRP